MKDFAEIKRIENYFLPLLENPCAQEAIARLRASQRNLLAFSHGTDSTALFYALLAARVPFAAALVNYGLREGAQREQLAASELCARFGVEFFCARAPRFSGNFEHAARQFRYEFFARLAPECLISAHQLNDQLEWLLMRLARGSGAAGLGAMSALSQRRNYVLVRPFARVEKSAILAALQASCVRYFVDESNAARDFERNRLRADFVDAFAREHAANLARSLDFLAADAARLAPAIKRFEHFAAAAVSGAAGGDTKAREEAAAAVAALCKDYGALLSRASALELAAQIAANGDAIAHTRAGDFAVAAFAEHIICAPVIAASRDNAGKCSAAASRDNAGKCAGFSKQQKELFRLHKIPAKLRPLCAAKPAALANLLALKQR